MSLSSRDTTTVWHPYTQVGLEKSVPGVVRAEGARFFLEDGRAIIDAVSSWWVNLHGHAHPVIAGAIAKQAASLEHVIFAGFTHEPAVALAEGLISILPQGLSRIFYSDNGSTAVEAALKMSLQYWHNRGTVKNRILSLEGAYHGDTFGAMSVGKGLFTTPFSELLFEVGRIPFPECEAHSLEVLEKELSSGSVAAFIIEPLVQGAAGMRMYGASFLRDAEKVCRRYGTHLIIDEVMTGFGRTGPLFASHEISPDIVCLSKGVTGGALPLRVTAAREELFEGFKSSERMKMFLHGHSYTGNPLACAAGVASLSLLRTDECAGARRRIEGRHKEFRAKHASRFYNVRVLGTILALEIGASEGYDARLRDRIYSSALERGVLLRPLGNTVYVLPPYCITDEELSLIYRVIEELPS